MAKNQSKRQSVPFNVAQLTSRTVSLQTALLRSAMLGSKHVPELAQTYEGIVTASKLLGTCLEQMHAARDKVLAGMAQAAQRRMEAKAAREQAARQSPQSAQPAASKK